MPARRLVDAAAQRHRDHSGDRRRRPGPRLYADHRRGGADPRRHVADRSRRRSAAAPPLLVRDLTLQRRRRGGRDRHARDRHAGHRAGRGRAADGQCRRRQRHLLHRRQRLEVLTPAGSVRVRDAAGAPGGTLLLASNNIWVASPAIIDRLRADPNYAGRDADLLDNGGADVPRGYVEANGGRRSPPAAPCSSRIAARPALRPADFGGITVGPGGLTVRPTGAAPASSPPSAGGSTPTAASPPATPSSSRSTSTGGGAGGSYTAGSTLQHLHHRHRPMPGAAAAAIPARAGRDPITGPTGGSDGDPAAAGAEEDDLVDTSFAAEPLIEEPVTSGGEASLWDCDRDHDGDCDDERRCRRLALAALALAAAGRGARRSRSATAQSFRIGIGRQRALHRPVADPATAPSPTCSTAAMRSSAATPRCRSASSTCCALRGGDPGGAAGGDARRAGDLRGGRAGRDRGARRGRDARAAGSTTADVGYRVYLRRGAAARSTSPRGWPAMTARCGSACAASSPTARSRARSRSRPPAPAIPPPSPGSRPARSIRSARSPRPIAATMPAAMPKASEFFAALTAARRQRRRPGRGAGQRGAAEIQSRPLCRGRLAVRARRARWPAPIR